MDNQEFLNKAYEHMRKQMSRCITEWGHCKYDHDGRQCAVGGVLSPEAREEAMAERLNGIHQVYSLPNAFPKVYAELQNVSPRLAMSVQARLHDDLTADFTVEELNECANRIAERFQLTSPARS